MGVFKQHVDEVDLKRSQYAKDWDVETEWKEAFCHGKHQINVIMSIMLNRPDRDPSRAGGGWKYTLAWTSHYGYTELVRTLLADSRVYPAAMDN